MKFLKSLLGKDNDEAPTWEVRPASDRPPRKRTEPLPGANADNKQAPAPTAPKKDANPFLDDPMLDTMTLEVDLLSEEDNPYSTHSWTSSPNNETRKLKTVQIGTKTEKPDSAAFNPYDTGKMRRSWKR